MMHEFDIIKHYFSKLQIAKKEVILGIGDDCAGLSIPADQDLWVTTDTLIENVHFLANWSGYDVAYKALMVNLSDCAAMGAKPFAFNLALTLPKPDQKWLESFCLGLQAVMAQHNVTLFGGDTTKGPLSITITAYGLGPRTKVIKRSGAKSGEAIFVSGYLGSAAFGVDHLAKIINADPKWVQPIFKSLHHPQARLDCIDLLREFASSCIDISDGLLADLNHICKSSNTGAELNLASIPIHPALNYWFQEGVAENLLDYALYGGDDYELCFSVPKDKITAFLTAAKHAKQKFFLIGYMNSTKKLSGLNDGHEYVELPIRGYQHF